MAKVRNRRQQQPKQPRSFLINVLPKADLLKLQQQLKNIKKRTRAQSRMIHLLNVELSKRETSQRYFISSLSGNKPKSLNLTQNLKEALNG